MYIFSNFQFQNSLYTVVYLGSSSWLHAEQYCANDGRHLWSINSFDEWYNVYQSVQHATMFDKSGGFIMISTILFIGLTKDHLVKILFCWITTTLKYNCSISYLNSIINFSNQRVVRYHQALGYKSNHISFYRGIIGRMVL